MKTMSFASLCLGVVLLGAGVRAILQPDVLAGRRFPAGTTPLLPRHAGTIGLVCGLALVILGTFAFLSE